MWLPIIYFSSSGNTKYICEIVARGLNSASMEAELIPLKKIGDYPNFMEESVGFGIGAPVYGGNFTPNIVEWMHQFPITNEKKYFFLIDTNAGLPCAALIKSKNILTKKGYTFIVGLEITAPTRDSVFWMDFFEHVSWPLNSLKRAFYFGKRIAQNLKTGTEDVVKEFRIMPLGNILSNLFPYIERRFYIFMTKIMAHNPTKCVKCGACESLCPAGAIDVQKNIYFDPEKCFFCFKCMRNCPKGALYLKIYPKAKFFKGPFQVKGYIKPDELRF